MSFEDWHWQLENRISTVKELEQYINLTDDEKKDIEEVSKKYSWSTTPYYASLMSTNNQECPIRKQALPNKNELFDPFGVEDPLHEEEHQPTKGLVRVYPDRLAFTVSNQCAMLCRHCFRKKFVNMAETYITKDNILESIEWLKENSEIRDVLLTGGDPFLNETDWLEEIIARLREIEHIEIVRIGTRTPCTMPQRITPELCSMLNKYHPLWVNVQFNHPKELTEQASKACEMLSEAGIPLGNQSVLLKGVNDDPEIYQRLVHGLVKMRVRPYYLYQCQILHGTNHFRTPIESGINIIKKLQGFTSGFSVPVYLLDTPYGKCPMSPQNIVYRDEKSVSLRNFEGKIWTEPNHMPGKETIR